MLALATRQHRSDQPSPLDGHALTRQAPTGYNCDKCLKEQANERFAMTEQQPIQEHTQHIHDEWLADGLRHEPGNSFDHRLSQLPGFADIANNPDPVAHIKFFICGKPWRWYVLVADRTDRGDWRLHCYVTDASDSHLNECGDVMLSDLMSIVGPLVRHSNGTAFSSRFD